MLTNKISSIYQYICAQNSKLMLLDPAQQSVQPFDFKTASTNSSGSSSLNLFTPKWMSGSEGDRSLTMIGALSASNTLVSLSSLLNLLLFINKSFFLFVPTHCCRYSINREVAAYSSSNLAKWRVSLTLLISTYSQPFL